MIQVNPVPGGAPCLGNLALLLAFFTIVTAAAQDDEIVIRKLDIFHTFCSWPTFNEGVLLTGCMWCFRVVERLLGTKLLLVLLAYNCLTFTPFFAIVVYFRGFGEHFSFFYFVPFSLYVFTFWHIPSLNVVAYFSDKMLLTILVVAELGLHLPFSLVPLATSIVGCVLWDFDVMRLRQLCETRESLASEERVVVNMEQEAVEVSTDKVSQMEEMGFTRAQALEALRNNGDDMQKAVDSLLKL